MNGILLKLFTDYVVPGLGTAIMGLITYGSGLLISKINTKLKNDQVKQALEQLSKITKTVVADINQTVVSDIKSRTADGKLSSEDMREIKAKAVMMIKAQMQTEFLELLEKNTIDVDGLISSTIESSVFELKCKP
jgi:uncharacterized protein